MHQACEKSVVSASNTFATGTAANFVRLGANLEIQGDRDMKEKERKFRSVSFSTDLNILTSALYETLPINY